MARTIMASNRSSVDEDDVQLIEESYRDPQNPQMVTRVIFPTNPLSTIGQASQSDIDNLPFFIPQKNLSDCAICSEPMDEGHGEIMTLPCFHFFHKDCVVPWLLQGKAQCPQCRNPIKNAQ